MSDAELNEAVARAMGLEILDRDDLPLGWRGLFDFQLMRGVGCLIDHRGNEWDYLADDYSGVPAMEAWCRERGWSWTHESGPGGTHWLRFANVRGEWPQAPTYPRALALAIDAAVEAGR